VGQNGTVWHALVLGLVVTLTHTGAVILLAALLPLFFSGTPEATVQTVLELVGGLLIAGLGFWLLLNRLAGRADHVHLGGGHSHGHGHSHAHGHDHAHQLVRPGWWGLLVLGVQGGIVPCWDAIAVLTFSISKQLLSLALPLVLAFSAGLAAMLIVLGITVVQARNVGAPRLGGAFWPRLVRALPLLSAALITLMGLWMCFDSVRAGKPR
jgi:nickel/cobalt transporter (NicO) family protein